MTAPSTGTIVDFINVNYDPDVTTDDLWYGNETLSALNVTINEEPTSVRDWNLLHD